MKQLFLLTAAAVIALSLSNASPPNETEKPSYGKLPVNTASEALDLALAYTGFADLEGLNLKDSKEMVQLTVVRDSTTPFLSDSIDGRTVWRVEFQRVILDLEGVEREKELKYPKNATVTIDSATGRLFEIRVIDSGADYDLNYEMPACEAEKRINGMDEEKYMGFPPEVPRITFLEALNAEKLWGSPLTSKFTTGRYVMHWKLRSDTLPAWVVHMHGFSQFRGPGQTHWRNVVNTATNKRIHVINSP